MNLLKFKYSKEDNPESNARIMISQELEETFTKNFFSLMDVDYLKCQRIVHDDGMIEFIFNNLSPNSLEMMKDLMQMLSSASFPKQSLN